MLVSFSVYGLAHEGIVCVERPQHNADATTLRPRLPGKWESGSKECGQSTKSYLKHFPNSRPRQQDVLPDSGIAGCGVLHAATTILAQSSPQFGSQWRQHERKNNCIDYGSVFCSSGDVLR